MRGYIRKRDDRKWQLTYDVPRGPDGKRQQRYETVNGIKKQAEARLTEILRSVNRGRYFEPTTLTVAQYLDQWLRDYAEVSVRPRTLQGYRSIIETHLKPSFGHMRLTEMSAQDVQTFYASQVRSGLSPQTVTHQHRVLRQAINQAARWDMLQRNIMDRVTPPTRRKPELRSLEVDEARSLLKAAEGTDYHLPIHLAIYTGLRRSEILGLRWSDVDLDGRTLTVTRTMVDLVGKAAHVDEPKSRRSRRAVSIDETTSMMLRAQRERREAQLEARGLHLSTDDQLCIRPNGSLMRPSTLSHSYSRIAIRCGIKGVRFHDLRHTHATMLLESGVPVHVVQARLGHESIQTTVDTYGHVLPASDAEAGAALARKLDVGRMWAERGPSRNE